MRHSACVASLGVFLLGLAVMSPSLEALEPWGGRDAAIVASGGATPAPLLIDTGGSTPLDVVVALAQSPRWEAFRYSLWLVGGESAVPLLRNEPLKGEVETESTGSYRLHFNLPILRARPGAALRLAIDDGSSHPVARAWLLVSEPFDPKGLRDWADRHPCSVDPALPGATEAFCVWRVPHKDLGDAPLAILSANTKPPTGLRAALILRPSRDGRVRIVVRPNGGCAEVDAQLPSLVAFTRDPSARHDLLLGLREAAAECSDDNSFPDP